MKDLHGRLALFIDGHDAYTFFPVDSPGSQSLTIYRNSGDIVLNKPNAPVPPRTIDSGKSIYGIFGLITLSSSEYLIVVTGREPQGRLMGHDIYRATDFDILPLNTHVSVQHPPHPVEGHLLALVRSHLYGSSLLFSYSWDLTRRLQAQWDSHEDDEMKAMWEVADDRFFWNKFLHSRFISTSADPRQDLGAFILPVIYGTFEIRTSYLQGRRMQLCVISRRSRFRAGTRYFRRGIDHEGHTANFNESEQLLLVEGEQSATQPASDDFTTKFSFVQIRGSVPLFWAEINTLRYKPDLQIMDLQDTVDAMRLHLQEQVSTYGTQILVSLLNKKGHEKPINDAYERYAAQVNLQDVQYNHFDFHHECKNMRWDRISLLTDKLAEDLTSEGYFQLDNASAQPIKRQLGVVRTNCLDNLDRTNVVQANLAKWTLNRQLQALGLLKPNDSIEDYEILHRDFCEIWADHGDEIATAYSGTGALKSDFTRTNKRTTAGVMQDGYKSFMRYLKNNYFDGARQDAFDLITGAWIPRDGPSAASFLVTDDRPLLIRSMPYVMFYSLFMICAGLTLPRTSDYSLFYYFIFWLVFLWISLLFIFVNGIEYVSWPRMIPPTDIVYYNGPGFRSAHHGKGLRLSRTRKLAVRRRTGSVMQQIELGTKKRVD